MVSARRSRRNSVAVSSPPTKSWSLSLMSPFVAEYITPQGAIGIKQYKYSGINESVYYKYLSGPWAQFWVDRLPPSVAPNVLTLLGFFNVLCAYALVWYYCPTFTESAPSWVWYMVSLLLFTYRTLDNMDGKQARRLGCGSALGLSLDHGCDAVATVLIPAIGCAYLELGQTASSVVLMVTPPIVAFFLNWEEFYTGTFYLGAFNAVDEGGLLTDLTFLSAGILGPEKHSQFVSTIAFETAPFGFLSSIYPMGIRVKDLWVISLVVGALFTIIPAVVKVVRIEKWKKAMYHEFGDEDHVVIDGQNFSEDDGSPRPWSARHYKGKSPRVRDALGALLPVIIGSGLWVGAVYFPSRQTGILLEHTRTIIWLGVMLFSKLITHLHVAHVCGDPYYQWRKTFMIPVALITVNSLYSDFVSVNGETIVDELTLLTVCASVATLSWLHMAYSVVCGMCEALDIPFLSVPQKCLKEYAKKTSKVSKRRKTTTKVAPH